MPAADLYLAYDGRAAVAIQSLKVTDHDVALPQQRRNVFEDRRRVGAVHVHVAYRHDGEIAFCH